MKKKIIAVIAVRPILLFSPVSIGTITIEKTATSNNYTYSREIPP